MQCEKSCWIWESIKELGEILFIPKNRPVGYVYLGGGNPMFILKRVISIVNHVIAIIIVEN